MNCFCTIITADYFFYAKTIYDSLKRFNYEVKFHVLIVDDFKEKLIYEGIEVSTLEELRVNFYQDYDLIKHYEDDKKSNLRWSLKPLFLKFLILEKSYDKIIFVDPDLYFYDSPFFLFNKLNDSDVIITPHWRSKDPEIDVINFNSLFSGGLFNAGFFGCNANSINILDWWLGVCAYNMSIKDGFYVDQGYLNLMPIYFSKQVHILEHKGCNVANWNMIECRRILVGNTVLINNEFPIIFIHYTNATIKIIQSGQDMLLKPFLALYKAALLKHNELLKFEFEKIVIPNQSDVTFKQKIKKLLKINF